MDPGKPAHQQLPPLFFRSPLSKRFYLSSAFSPLPQKSLTSLTEEELVEVHWLVLRLCDAVRHADAVRLLDVCLLASLPLAALPIPALVDRLASHPDFTPTMALLTALKHHPRRPSPLPLCSPLLSAFFEKRRPKKAAKVFAWLCRPDPPCRLDLEIYRIMIGGFCRLGRMAEALRAVKEVVGDRFSLGAELREAVSWISRRWGGGGGRERARGRRCPGHQEGRGGEGRGEGERELAIYTSYRRRARWCAGAAAGRDPRPSGGRHGPRRGGGRRPQSPRDAGGEAPEVGRHGE